MPEAAPVFQPDADCQPAPVVPQQPDTAFGRDVRLTSKADFSFVFDRAKKRSSRHFTVLFRPAGKDTARLGVIVSRKSAAKAVGRNRVKRLIRESFRQCRDQLPSVDIVVMARPGIVRQENRELTSQLEAIWSKL